MMDASSASMNSITAQQEAVAEEQASSLTDAAGIREPPQDAAASKPEDIPAGSPECAICLQSCVHPVRLPCSHVFCYLCVKGVASHSRRCALCRAEIPQDFVRRPMLVSREEVLRAVLGTVADPEQSADESTGSIKYCWYYEGVDGWWAYDERTSIEIEKQCQNLQHVSDDVPALFELLIAGFIYVIDIDNMVQYRRGYPGRRRRIKRDHVGIPDCKGVAGIFCRKKAAERSVADGVEKQNVNASASAVATSTVTTAGATNGTSSSHATQLGHTHNTIVIPARGTADATPLLNGHSSSDVDQSEDLTQQLTGLDLVGARRRRAASSDTARNGVVSQRHDSSRRHNRHHHRDRPHDSDD